MTDQDLCTMLSDLIDTLWEDDQWIGTIQFSYQMTMHTDSSSFVMKILRVRCTIINSRVNETYPMPINSSSDDIILDWSKFKTFADDKIYVT